MIPRILYQVDIRFKLISSSYQKVAFSIWRDDWQRLANTICLQSTAVFPARERLIISEMEYASIFAEGCRGPGPTNFNKHCQIFISTYPIWSQFVQMGLSLVRRSWARGFGLLYLIIKNWPSTRTRAAHAQYEWIFSLNEQFQRASIQYTLTKLYLKNTTVPCKIFPSNDSIGPTHSFQNGG